MGALWACRRQACGSWRVRPPAHPPHPRQATAPPPPAPAPSPAARTGEQLVERLVALLVEPDAALSTHRIQLVDEHNAGRFLAGLPKQLPAGRRRRRVRGGHGSRERRVATNRLCQVAQCHLYPACPPTGSALGAEAHLMRAAPRPTNSSTNSEAETAKKGTPASPATARAAGVGRREGGGCATVWMACACAMVAGATLCKAGGGTAAAPRQPAARAAAGPAATHPAASCRCRAVPTAAPRLASVPPCGQTWSCS